MPAVVPTKLPDEPQQLKSLIGEMSRDICQYQARIDYLTRRLFGKSSERFDAIERTAAEKNLEPVARYLLRNEKSHPVLDSLKKWAAENQQQVLPKSPIGQAIGYMQNHWDALNRNLENGSLSIDNNAAERALRGCVVGRKKLVICGK